MACIQSSLSHDEAMKLLGKSRNKGVTITKGMYATEMRKKQDEAEQRAALAVIDMCLAPGVTVEALVNSVQPLHKATGATGIIEAIYSQLAVWGVLQHAYNSSAVRQQGRRCAKLKRSFTQRVARMVSVKVPELVRKIESEFVEAVCARLAKVQDVTDEQMSNAIEETIVDGVHLTRTVWMEARSPASRAAEKKGSLHAEWGNGNRRPQVQKADLRRSDALDSKVHVSVRARPSAALWSQLTRVDRTRSFTMTGTQPVRASATHRSTPMDRLSAVCAKRCARSRRVHVDQPPRRAMVTGQREHRTVHHTRAH